MERIIVEYRNRATQKYLTKTCGNPWSWLQLLQYSVELRSPTIVTHCWRGTGLKLAAEEVHGFFIFSVKWVWCILLLLFESCWHWCCGCCWLTCWRSCSNLRCCGCCCVYWLTCWSCSIAGAVAGIVFLVVPANAVVATAYGVAADIATADMSQYVLTDVGLRTSTRQWVSPLLGVPLTSLWNIRDQ